MRIFSILSVCLSIFFPFFMDAGGGTCPRCEIIREYHDKHPEENYYWYDDYVEEKGNVKDYQPKKEQEKTQKSQPGK